MPNSADSLSDSRRRGSDERLIIRRSRSLLVVRCASLHKSGTPETTYKPQHMKTPNYMARD